MRLDVSIMYLGLGMEATDQLELVLLAEQLGYDTAWVAEAYGSDAATMLGWLAARTTRIGLGSAMFQMPARSPAMTAMTAATLDVLSRGRMRLGVAPSGPQVAEGWHGEPYGSALRRTREYVQILRLVLSGARLEYDGEIYRLPLPGGRGRPLKLNIAPVQEQIPIYVGGLGPKSVALAAELADGWIPMFLSPAHYREQFLPHLEAGASRAGRPLSDLDVNPIFQLFIDDDIERARDQIRPFLALYVGGMGSKGANFYHDLVTRYGFESAADSVQELFLGGNRSEAERALPAELIDAVSLCGPPAVVRERLALLSSLGIDHITVMPPFGGWTSEFPGHLRRLAEIASAPAPTLAAS